MFFSHFAILGLAALSSAINLATTTRYLDGTEGACGCGTNAGNFPWQLNIAERVYTAAGSQALFDSDPSTGWCGGGCGKCYKLTSTGKAPCTTCGEGESAGESIIVMVTNLCPNSGNEEWCPAVGGKNAYGYGYHFDIMAESEVFGDNSVVSFQQIDCPGQAISDWDQCVCNGQTKNGDTTPVGLDAPPASPSSPAVYPSSTSVAPVAAAAATPPVPAVIVPDTQPSGVPVVSQPAKEMAPTTAAAPTSTYIPSTFIAVVNYMPTSAPQS